MARDTTRADHAHYTRLPGLLRRLAMQRADDILVSQGYEEFLPLGRELHVRVKRLSPRVLRVDIARRGDSPNWDLAADSCVLEELDARAPITHFQRVPRERWRLWPIPSGALPRRSG